jgi:hypothetical protein
MKGTKVLRGNGIEFMDDRGDHGHDFGSGFWDWWENMCVYLQSCELCSAPVASCIAVPDGKARREASSRTLFSICLDCELTLKRPITILDPLLQEVLAVRRWARVVNTSQEPELLLAQLKSAAEDSLGRK